MVASLAGGVVGPGCAAELGADGQEGLVQQSAALEVEDQRGDRAIDPECLRAVVLHVAVSVPVVVGAGIDQFDDADAAFDHPAAITH